MKHVTSWDAWCKLSLDHFGFPLGFETGKVAAFPLFGNQLCKEVPYLLFWYPIRRSENQVYSLGWLPWKIQRFPATFPDPRPSWTIIIVASSVPGSEDASLLQSKRSKGPHVEAGCQLYDTVTFSRVRWVRGIRMNGNSWSWSKFLFLYVFVCGHPVASCAKLPTVSGAVGRQDEIFGEQESMGTSSVLAV